MSDQIILGITGMGGFAGQMLNGLLGSEAAASGVRVGAVCEPQPERFRSIVEELTHRKITVLTDYSDLLTQNVDAIYLPLPIHLHRQYTERALAAGKPVLCEKPAAGCVDDVDAMIKARDQSSLPAAVAFQHAYLPSLRRIKQRLVAGEFGSTRRATVLGCWPRDEAYFRRSDWAGKISHDGQMVLDSPANNAMAHYIHLCLFLLGSTSDRSASPKRVESELYRANSIENYDTCSLRATLDAGAEMLVGMTHACATPSDAEVAIYTDRAEIRFFSSGRIELKAEGNEETIPLETSQPAPMFRAFAEYVKTGNSDSVATMEMARSHSAVITAASKASSVVTVPANAVTRVNRPDGKILHWINGIEEALRQSVRAGQMLHESRLAPWAHRGGMIELDAAAKQLRLAP